MNRIFRLLAIFAMAVVLAVDFVLELVERGVRAIAESAHRIVTRFAFRQGLMLGANYFADIQTVVNGPQGGLNPTTRNKVHRQHGRIRFLQSQFVAPSGLAVADVIYWGKVPVGSLILGYLSRLIWTTGAASSTLNLGDNITPARYLAATSVTTAGNATPTVADLVNTGTASTVTGSPVLTVTQAGSFGAFEVGNYITGTGIASNSVITGISMNGTTMLVTLNNAATATGTGVTMTMTGSPFRTTDDSNSVANGFASTSDDCTIRSTIAGAALPQNQVVSLMLAYVHD